MLEPSWVEGAFSQGWLAMLSPRKMPSCLMREACRFPSVLHTWLAVALLRHPGLLVFRVSVDLAQRASLFMASAAVAGGVDLGGEGRASCIV